MNCILGKKVGMLQLFDLNGNLYPATIIHCEPNKVIKVKTKAKDGLDAIQVAFDTVEEKKLNRCQKGIFKKNNCDKFYKYLQEFSGVSGYTVGQEIKVDQCFKPGEFVDVQGKTKGHGFTGAIKRWNFKIGPLSHGAGYPHRYQGSIAFGRGGSQAQRVKKGQKMSGHYGCEKVTIQNLLVLAVDKDNNTITIKGSVPGPINQILKIKNSVKNKKAVIVPDLICKTIAPTSSISDDSKKIEQNNVSVNQQSKIVPPQQKEKIVAKSEGK